MKRGRLYIGTSGWSYAGWRSGFYAGVKNKDWLRYCGARFTALEINGTFYHQLKPATFERWHESVPADFRFAVKAHRFLTHNKKLKPPIDAIERQRDQAAPLGEKLAAVLWQMPANLTQDLERLEAFAIQLKVWPHVAHAFEFRHSSWFDEATAGLMRRYGLTVCQSDAAGWPMWRAITSSTVYMRLHGHSVTYHSNYDDDALNDLADQALRWRQEGRDVHIYFDNDARGYAPVNAARLIELIEKASGEAVVKHAPESGASVQK